MPTVPSTITKLSQAQQYLTAIKITKEWVDWVGNSGKKSLNNDYNIIFVAQTIERRRFFIIGKEVNRYEHYWARFYEIFCETMKQWA